MTRLTWILALAVCAAYHNRREVERRDWPAIPENNNITVRTLDGGVREFNAFVFTTTGLSAWRRRADSVRVDSTLVPLDSIAVVRVSAFNRSGTLLLVAAATTAAFIVLQQTKSDVRPEPVPGPPSSCPFIFSFDGENYVFDSETYAGAVAKGLERSDVDNLEHLRAVGGRYRLRVKNDRPETDYTDELTLLVADHPRATRAVPDATGTVHVVGEGVRPISTSEFGGDTIPSRAGWEVAFRRPPGSSDTVALVVRARNSLLAPFVIEKTLSLLGSDVYAWYASMRTQLVTRAVVRAWMETESYLEVRTSNAEGAPWRTVARLPDVGAALAKTNVVVVDLGKAHGDTVRVRLESSPGLWLLENVELAAYHGRAATQSLRAAHAVDERGTDVSALLAERDGKYVVTTRGSVLSLEFEAPTAPAPDMTRSVLARTTGHYYMETDEGGTPRRAVVERLMRDRAFAQSYFADGWTRAGGAPLIRSR